MSNAAASYVSRYDRIDDDGDDDQPFWLYDPDGDPVVIPAACVGFQVRYWVPNQRGFGTVVVDVRNGRPLILPRSTSPDEFAERVGYKVGRYRLFLLDGAHRRMECSPGQLEITPEMAAARGVVQGPASSTVAPTGDAITLAQVLAFVERMSAQAFAQSASAQHELAESQRHMTMQVATMVGTTSGVLTAAGSSGVVKKTLAIDAAALGAPVTVQMMPSNGNETAPTPRNAAGAASATATAAAVEKGGGMGDALVTLGLPLFEKIGTVLAYGAAKKLDVPEDYARSVAGLVQTTAQIAGKMMQSEPEAPPPGTGAPTVGVAARVGRELMAHVLEIQRALPEDDRGWVMEQMGARQGLIDALTPAVASLTVEEGAAAVRNLRAMDAALSTDHERRLFDTLMEPEQLPKVFRRLFVDASAAESIEHVRQHAAQIAGIAAAREAADGAANG